MNYDLIIEREANDAVIRQKYGENKASYMRRLGEYKLARSQRNEGAIAHNRVVER